MADIVRVLRIVEYVGERTLVEKQIRMSVQGTRIVPCHLEDGTPSDIAITATTLGDFAEVLYKSDSKPKLFEVGIIHAQSYEASTPEKESCPEG